MTSTDSAENHTSIHDSNTDAEKALPVESDFSGENESNPPKVREKIPDDATKTEETSRQDGGAAAWLNVLGAWCCSFSSPGWANSKFFPSFQYPHKLPRYDNH